MGINPNQINIIDNTGLSAQEGSVIVSKNTGENVWSSNSTKSIVIPVGTTAQRDAAGSTGQFRVNSDLNVPEITINGNWKTFSQLNLNGDQITPSISFVNDSHTGIFLPQTGQLGLTVSKATCVLITPLQTTVYGAAMITGTVTNSGIIFSSYPGNAVGLTVNRPSGPAVTFLYDDTTGVQSWVAGTKIKSNFTPTQNDDLANKAYVDAQIAGGGFATTSSYGTVKLATLSQANAGTSGVVATTDVAKASLTATLDARFGTNNSLIWSSTNQGPGTGMNADLLDGQHGTYYATVSSLGSYVSKAGDTMTGPLVLPGSPVSNLQAAPKQYVDTKVSLSGGTMTGALTLASDPSAALQASTKQYTDTKVAKSGDAMTGILTLSGDPSSGLHAATKQYVDAAVAGATMSATQILNSIKTVDGSGSGLDADLLDGHDSTYFATATSDANKVSKTGDNMSGQLGVNGVSSSTKPSGWAGGISTFDLYATGTIGVGDASGNLKSYIGSTVGQIANNTIWHAGNDGSGSGLDADLLDGMDSSAFLQMASFVNNFNQGGTSGLTYGGTNYGYSKLPNNLLLQWGNSETFHSAEGVASVTFPLTYSQVLTVIAVDRGAGGQYGNSNDDMWVQVPYISNSGCSIMYQSPSSGNNGYGYRWLAIGIA